MASVSSPASSPISSAPNRTAAPHRAASYAKRFAAKEACAKALGTGLNQGVYWRDMGVVNLPGGKPTMKLTGGALARLQAITPPGHRAQIDLSITDDFPLAQAIVIISAVQRPELTSEILDRRGRGPFLSPRPLEQPELMADTPTADEAGRQGRNKGESWAELAKTVIYAGLIAIVIRTFLFQPFNIPSASMEATLLVGDYLFVEKFAYGYSRYTFPFGGWPFGDSIHGRFLAREPQRGDVIVFKFPQDNSTDFIKRLIGLPGDRIQMKNGVFYLNDKPVPRKCVSRIMSKLSTAKTHHVPQYRETLPGGKSYLTLDRDPDGPAGQYRCLCGAARTIIS